ncbi:cell filamentation protein Fic [Fulvivirga sp. M361]|uniref:Fic family protein n=1 Tax=Fulvivirga sp. M361 TaxID=2594266 RepID=UPI0011798AB8|nr:Fic family protein [Fulvivirga sp. M361]TRX60762.1 cell filamentation protein Fic [Fulvivirga sp. M361]
MENILPIHLQEVIYGSSDPAVSKQISKLEKEGKIRKIASRLYSANFGDSPENIVRRNLFSILGHLYPGAILSHRSALEFKPTSRGQLFLTYKYTRKAELPGVMIRLLEGNGPIEGDNPLSGKLYASQRERAFLENLQTSRKPGPDSKTLNFPVIEEYLEQIIRVNGEEELNKVRDRARVISEKLGMQKEFLKLNKIISALLSTHPSNILKSPVASARAFGSPYDPNRLELFESLFRELSQQEFKYRKEKNTTNRSFRNFALFESYFSNYIEGTVFELEEAKQIIETQKPLATRNEDSHDVLGTYHIVSKKEAINVTPSSPEELLELLKYRHKILLSARIDKKPGEFKDKNNFAGQTAFVDASLVRGTIIKSFDFYQALRHPFAKAAYMMFMVSEVHPFLDGNGRIARVMMNAELVKGEQAKIIIPTVYRDDYLGALRKLTRQRDPKVYIRMLMRVHEFSASIVGESIDHMQLLLEKSNAFLEHTEGKLRMVK